MVRAVTELPVREERKFRMRYDDYRNSIDEWTHSEWVDGEVTIFMPPTDRHQSISVFLSALLLYFLDMQQLGIVRHAPFEMKIRGGRSYREPDIVVLLNEHRQRLTTQRIDGPGDLVIEIMSSESTSRDRGEKFREYAEAGISEYWILDARSVPSAVRGYQLDGTGSYIAIDIQNGRLASSILPGFWIDEDWFAREQLPSFPAICALLTA